MKKIFIVLGLFIALGANAQFTAWPEVQELPTTQEIIAGLTNGQKTGVVDAFAEGKSVSTAKYELNMPTAIVSYFYAYFRQINTTADQLMVTYNLNSAPLIDSVYSRYSDDFTESQIQYILSVKVSYSDGKGNANWAYYKAKVRDEE